MRQACTLLALAGVLSGLAGPALAGVNVERQGAENPMIEVSRSVIYGGLAGLVVGTAIAVATEGGNDGDVIRWCFAGGTVLGLGMGLYFVSTRPQPTGLLELGREKPALHAPTLARSPGGGADLYVVTYRF